MGADREGNRRAGEAGFVAGAEALILGVLVFVFGTLAILNGWAVLDAKFATSAAAREAVRTIVTSDPATGTDAVAVRAAAAAEQAIVAHDYDATALRLEVLSGSPARRCESIRVGARIEVRSIVVPGVAGPATFTVASEHEEVVHPYRSGLDGEADCGF